MGFLKNLISNAVKDGVRKGVRDAVGGAIESAVRPSAEKLANEAANHLNEAANSVNQAADSVQEAAKTAAQENPEAFNELKKAAENYKAVIDNAVKEAEKAAKEAEIPEGVCPFENIRDFLPDIFPAWDCGGSCHELYNSGCKDDKGNEIVKLRCGGTQENLDKYLAKLKDAGFAPKGDVWEKTVLGTTYCLDTTDACEDGSIIISYFTK